LTEVKKKLEKAETELKTTKAALKAAKDEMGRMKSKITPEPKITSEPVVVPQTDETVP
jgi:hypothetical protein